MSLKDSLATQLDICKRNSRGNVWENEMFLKYQWQNFVLDVTLQTLISLNLSEILHYNTLCPFNYEFGSLNKHFDAKNSLHNDHLELLRTLRGCCCFDEHASSHYHILSP